METTQYESSGDRIRRSREALRMTQEELAAYVGVTRAAVSQWESGDTKSLKPENLFRVAKKLNKSAEWLATGEGSEVPKDGMFDIIAGLPTSNSLAALDNLEYQVDRASGALASDVLASYRAFIGALKRQLETAKK